MILTDFQGFLKGAAVAAVASLGLVLAQPAAARDAPQSPPAAPAPAGPDVATNDDAASRPDAAALAYSPIGR